jgi:hypothetical protein
MHWVIGGLDGSKDEIPVAELCAEELPGTITSSSHIHSSYF